MRYFPPKIKMFPDAITAEVIEIITPHCPGRVKYLGCYYFAQWYPSCSQDALPGDLVLVIGRQSITLLVVPCSS